MADSVRVDVDGQAELSRALDDAFGSLGSAADEGSREAARLVASAAQRRALSIGGSAAKGAPTIGASGDRIGFGGSTAPWMQAAEFGGAPRFPQFEPWHGTSSRTAGYFVYPAIRSEEDEITEAFADPIDDRITRHF